MEQIQFDHLNFSFNQDQPILDDLNLSLPSHSVTLLHGPIGCGKTTLLKIIAGLLPKYGGNLTGEVKLPEDQRVRMLFQDPTLQFTMDTVQHELEFTLENLQVPASEIPSRVQEALAFVKLEDLAQRKLTTLSGGQLQRVALAITVALSADIILLDEPFASVDPANRDFLIQQLTKLHQEKGTTIILSDHDLTGYAGFVENVVTFANHQATLLPTSKTTALLKQAQVESVNLTTALPAKDEPAAFKLTNFSISREKPLFSCLDLSLIEGKTTLLTGPSGVGKSTLLSALAKLCPYSGNISYRGKNIQKIFPRKYYWQVGLIFQETNLQFLNVTVGEELALSKKNGRHSYFTKLSSNDLLHLIGLDGFEDRVIYSLSGGQRKLVQNLVMLMMGQDVLLMDEPFAGLDHASAQRLIKIIQDGQSQLPQTIILVSHQLADLESFVDYHLALNNQQLRYVKE